MNYQQKASADGLPQRHIYINDKGSTISSKGRLVTETSTQKIRCPSIHDFWTDTDLCLKTGCFGEYSLEWMTVVVFF